MLRKNNSIGLLFNGMNERVCSGKSCIRIHFLPIERVCSGKKRLIWSLCPFFHYFMDERTSKTGYYASLRR